MTELQEATLTDAPALPADRARLRSAAGTVSRRGQELGARFHKVHLAHARPRTFAEEWARHRKVAASHNAPVLQAPRYAWAVIHMAIKAVCVLVEWATFSPAVTILAAALVTILVFLI